MVKKEINTILLETAINATRKAKNYLLKKQKTAKIKVLKEKGDFALDADIEAEKIIKKTIKEKFPDHSFLAEESNFENKKSDYIWVIDPLDSTLNYANKIPFFAISLAVLFKNEVIIAVVSAPLQNELFYAVKNKGAFLNKKRISVNKNKDKDNMFIVTNPKNWLKINKKINFSMTRYFGCSSLELAYVACGRFAARIKNSNKSDPFGTVAGKLLVEEAGGKFTDLENKTWRIKTKKYLASNKIVHDKLLRILKNL